METLEKKPFLPNANRGSDEENLTKECLYLSNIQINANGLLTTICLIVSIGLTAIQRIRSDNYWDWVLPYGSVTVVNITYSPNFEMIYIYQIFCTCGCGACYVIVDMTTVTLLVHVTYQLKMLQNSIANIINLSYKDMLKDSKQSAVRTVNTNQANALVIPWKYLQKRLKQVVEYHISIIEVSEYYEDIFSGLFLISFASSLGTISLMIYHVSQ
ncbi:hypothetical protein ILUMI_26384, partial [Ignelater luminosus]